MVDDKAIEDMVKQAEKEAEADNVAPFTEEEELMLTYRLSKDSGKALVGKVSANALRRVVRGYLGAGLDNDPKLIGKEEKALYRAMNAVRNTMFQLTKIAEQKKLESEKDNE